MKRNLNIESLLPEVRDGMLAAVLYGTARLSYISDDEQALGKTGTCSEDGSRLGWFVSYADQTHPKIVLVILMRGHSSAIKGPMAAGVAGRIYRRLNDENYFCHAQRGSSYTVGGNRLAAVAFLSSEISSSGFWISRSKSQT